MRKFKNKKLFLVTYGDVGGKTTRILFTKRMRAYRLAAQLNASFIVNNDVNQLAEVTEIIQEQVNKLKIVAMA